MVKWIRCWSYRDMQIIPCSLHLGSWRLIFLTWLQPWKNITGEKNKAFWKPALGGFCVAELQRHYFPISNSEGWCWYGWRTHTCCVQEWMLISEWLYCLLLMACYLSYNFITTEIPEIPTQDMCPLSCGGIPSCCSTLGLLQASKW